MIDWIGRDPWNWFAHQTQPNYTNSVHLLCPLCEYLTSLRIDSSLFFLSILLCNASCSHIHCHFAVRIIFFHIFSFIFSNNFQKVVEQKELASPLYHHSVASPNSLGDPVYVLTVRGVDAYPLCIVRMFFMSCILDRFNPPFIHFHLQPNISRLLSTYVMPNTKCVQGPWLTSPMI